MDGNINPNDRREETSAMATSKTPRVEIITGTPLYRLNNSEQVLRCAAEWLAYRGHKAAAKDLAANWNNASATYTKVEVAQ